MRNNRTKIKYLFRFLPIVIMISNYQVSGTDKYTELKQEMNISYDSKEFLDEINNEIMKVIKDENFIVDSDETDNEQHKEFEYLLQHKFWRVSEKNNIEESDEENEKEQCNPAQNLKGYKNLSIFKAINYNYLPGKNMFSQTNNVYFFWPYGTYCPFFTMDNIKFPGFPNINITNTNNKEQIDKKEEIKEQESKNIEIKKEIKKDTESKIIQKTEKSNLTKLFEQIEIEKTKKHGKQKCKKINVQTKYKNNTKKGYNSYYGYQNTNKDNYNDINGYRPNNKWNNKKFNNKEYKTNNVYCGKYQYNKIKNNIQYKIKEDSKIKIKSTQSNNTNNILEQKPIKKKNNYTKKQ